MLPLISQLCCKVHEYSIAYSPIILTKFSWYSPILTFPSQTNTCQQQRQNVDHMPLKMCEEQILLAELLGFHLCKITIIEHGLTPCSTWQCYTNSIVMHVSQHKHWILLLNVKAATSCVPHSEQFLFSLWENAHRVKGQYMDSPKCMHESSTC